MKHDMKTRTSHDSEPPTIRAAAFYRVWDVAR